MIVMLRIWKVETGEYHGDFFKQKINLLSRKEIERYHLIKHSQTKKRFLFSHIALRQILSLYLQIAPQDIEIKFGEFGKPYIKKSSSLFFNMSHAENLTLVAVSNSEVGIDVEFVKAVCRR